MLFSKQIILTDDQKDKHMANEQFSPKFDGNILVHCKVGFLADPKIGEHSTNESFTPICFYSSVSFNSQHELRAHSMIPKYRSSAQWEP